jgi:hypothetical protein
MSVSIGSECGRIAALVAFGSMPTDPEAVNQCLGSHDERSTTFMKEMFVPTKLVWSFHYVM